MSEQSGMKPVIVDSPTYTRENTASLSRDDLISVMNHLAWLVGNLPLSREAEAQDLTSLLIKGDEISRVMNGAGR